MRQDSINKNQLMTGSAAKNPVLMQWNNWTSRAKRKFGALCPLMNEQPRYLVSSAFWRIIMCCLVGPPKGCKSSRAYHNAVSAGVARDVVFFVAAGARGGIIVTEAASGTATVDLDAVALASNTVSFASAVAAV